MIGTAHISSANLLRSPDWQISHVADLNGDGDASGAYNPQVENRSDDDPFALGPICYELTGQHTLEQYRYPTKDVQALVERFVRFAREHIETAAPA